MLPEWFDKIRLIQEQIASEREEIEAGLIRRGKHPHPTGFDYNYNTLPPQTPTSTLKPIASPVNPNADTLNLSVNAPRINELS